MTRLLKWIFSTNGILFTLVLGLLVNFLSNTLNDIIQRQRYLELLEYEVRSNLILSGTVVKDFNDDKQIQLKYLINDEVYKSGLNSGYILSIDSKTLNKLISFYEVVPGYNNILIESYSAVDRKREVWEDCVFSDKVLIGNNCQDEKRNFDEIVKFNSENIAKTWISIHDNMNSFVHEFNPTQERLKSPLLRLIMGTDSLEVLK